MGAIKFKRGTTADKPTLQAGEIYVDTDKETITASINGTDEVDLNTDVKRGLRAYTGRLTYSTTHTLTQIENTLGSAVSLVKVEGQGGAPNTYFLETVDEIFSVKKVVVSPQYDAKVDNIGLRYYSTKRIGISNAESMTAYGWTFEIKLYD